MEDVKYLQRKEGRSNSLVRSAKEAFLNKKLNNWFGFLLVGCIAITFGYLTAKELTLGLGLLGAVFGLLIVTTCVLFIEAGLYIILLYGFFAYFFSRLFFHDQFPIGVATDILVGATFLGVFIKNHRLKKNTLEFFHSRPTLFLFIIFVYLCVQLFNPSGGHSFEGWFQVIRKVLDAIVILFIAYNVFSDLRKITRFIKVLFVCAAVAGAYACFQQWHGLFHFEENWVKDDSVRFGLVFIHGNYRKFSFLPDPTSLGIIMAGCVLLFLVIGMNEKRTLRKILLWGGCLVMLMGMVYSGTRTANAMVVGGAGMYTLLTFHKTTTKFFAFLGFMAFLFLMYVPIYTNPTLIRFRTSFRGNKDDSYKIREVNRASIQPYIYGHPFGGGLGTTGGNGLKYNPNHQLAGFPPDSGYLNKALETGWVGLGLSCFLYFFTLSYTIRGYFRARSSQIKTLFAAFSAFLFAFYLGELVQEAVGQFTNMVVYYPVVAIIVRLRYLIQNDTKADQVTP
jgi:putative inorganic carbon (hco3(-)) transporter